MEADRKRHVLRVVDSLAGGARMLTAINVMLCINFVGG